MGYEVDYIGGSNPGYDMIATKYYGDTVEAVYIEVKSGPGARLSGTQREFSEAVKNFEFYAGDKRIRTKYVVCQCMDYETPNCVIIK